MKEEGVLDGWFVLTYDPDRLVDRQGRVIGRVEPGLYLVEWCSWVDGAPTHAALESLEGMGRWEFYRDEKTWREEAERQSQFARDDDNKKV